MKSPERGFFIKYSMNVDLIIRMYEMGYTAEAIHLRLRHSVEIIQKIIKNHEYIKNN